MSDIAFLSASELVAAIRTCEIGSRELLEHYLKRVERYNPEINAVVTLDVERARKRADAADAALARGEVFGPLHGLPMTIKDTIETAGLRTTAGAQVHAEHVPTEDAPAVARLVAAGAVIFGKTNTPVFAMDAQSYNPLFGVTNNPWDLTRSPGGSSGGAAAALAAGLTGLEVGSDIGGSIRNPAHYCGVYGHKPTFEIIPLRGHIPGPPGSLSGADIAVLGPLGRSANDLTLALDVLAGPDTDESVAWQLTLPPPRRASLQEYRIAAWLDEPACPIDAGVQTRFQSAVTALRKAGVQVDEKARPAFQFVDALHTYWRLLWAATSPGLPLDQFHNLVEMAGYLPHDEDSDLARLAHASTQRHRDWLGANEARAHYRVRWAEFFKNYDVLLCPITPTVAIPHDHSEPLLTRTISVNGQPHSYLDQIAWAGVIGMAYLPATMAPVGRTSEGLPVGMQIVGPYLEDRTPIDFARRLAEVIGGFAIPPEYE
jgi:amidase